MSQVPIPVPAASSTTMGHKFLFASTEELNGVIKKINPFEENFREANKTIKEKDVVPEQKDSSNRLLAVYPASTNSITDSFLNDISSSSICSTSISGGNIGIGMNSTVSAFRNHDGVSRHRQLSLKLPSSDLSASIQTPDLSTLINQVITNGSPLITAPQTADVLKTALDIRETAEMRRSSLGGFLFKTAAAPAPALIASSATENSNSLKIPSAQRESDVRRYKPPDDEFAVSSNLSPPPVAEQSLFYVPVKIGDQLIYIPMCGASAKIKQSETPSPLSSGGGLPSASIGRFDELPAVLSLSSYATQTQQNYGARTVCSPDHDSGSACSTCSQHDQKFSERSNIAEAAASPALSLADDEKRKESLERNKEAAWRYRKRKKEEKKLLEGRAKILENEKAELVAQVAILKSELTRVSQLLSEHKHCAALATSNGQGEK